MWKLLALLFVLVLGIAKVHAGIDHHKKSAPHVQKCVQVPYEVIKKGEKTSFVMKSFDCPETKLVKSCKIIEKVCQHDVAVDCSETVYKKVCQPPPKQSHGGHGGHGGGRSGGILKRRNSGKKGHVVPQPICSKVPMVISKMCTNVISKPCPEEVCTENQVIIPKVCQKKVPVSIPYEFREVKYRQECHSVPAPKHHKKGHY